MEDHLEFFRTRFNPMTKSDKLFIDKLFLKASLAGRPSESSLAKYRVLIERFFTVMGLNRIADLHSEDLQNFILKMRSRKVKDSYTANVLSAMRWLVFGYEKEFGQGKLNDVVAESIIRPRVPKREVDYLSEEEVRRFYQAIDTDRSKGSPIRKERFLALLSLLIQTGARIGEALSIKTADIDREMLRIPVIGKGDVKRTLIINDQVLKQIDKYLAIRGSSSEYIFLALSGKSRWQQTDVNRSFNRYRKLSGIIKKFTNHTLRHTFATHLILKNVSVPVVQKLLGHKNPKTTFHYYVGAMELNGAQEAIQDKFFDFIPEKEQN